MSASESNQLLRALKILAGAIIHQTQVHFYFLLRHTFMIARDRSRLGL